MTDVPVETSSPAVSGFAGWGATTGDPDDPVVLMREAAQALGEASRILPSLEDGTRFDPGDLPRRLASAANALAVSRYPKPSRWATVRRVADTIDGGA